MIVRLVVQEILVLDTSQIYSCKSADFKWPEMASEYKTPRRTFLKCARSRYRNDRRVNNSRVTLKLDMFY